MKVHLVFGTRPEIIKLAPVIHELQRRGISFAIIHTGQHYSENMDRIFWDTFELPEARYHLAVRETRHALQTAEMMRKLDDIYLTEKPDWVIVQGDTNSTMAGALTAAKHPSIRVAHVEAGLRSFDRSMPEEINRLVVDHTCDLLLPPTEIARGYLENEGLVGDKVVVTGNTVEDALRLNLPKALNESKILGEHQLDKKKFILLTVHRQENTDEPPRLVAILGTVFDCAKAAGLKVVFPIHPRTRDRLEKMKFPVPSHVKLIEPVGYFDFLVLQNSAAVAATDSGGVQEETCIMGIPCLTLRENTERPETVESGSNFLAGVSPEGIRQGFRHIFQGNKTWKSPYGEGYASARIMDAILAKS